MSIISNKKSFYLGIAVLILAYIVHYYEQSLWTLYEKASILVAAPSSPFAQQSTTTTSRVNGFHHQEPRIEKRNWTTHHRLRANGRRVISIPDIHGDYLGLVDILVHSKLIALDEKNNNETKWIGQNAILVQTGDILDRGVGSADALRLLAKLQVQAEKQGGQVIVLMGNHELLNLMGFFMYATPGEDAGFAPQSRLDAFDKIKGEFGSFVRSFPSAVVVEMGTTKDSSILFVHGGLSNHFIPSKNKEKDDDPIKLLNENFARFTQMETSQMKLHYANPLLSEHGPLWNRFFAMSPHEPRVCSALQETLDMARAGKMVVGHTVQQRSKVGTRCGGRLVMADVGFAPYYFGHRLALEHFENGSHQVIEDKLI